MPSPRIHVLPRRSESESVGNPGTVTFTDREWPGSVVRELCEEAANRHGLALSFRQTNVEHHLIEWLHEARTDAWNCAQSGRFLLPLGGHPRML